MGEKSAAGGGIKIDKPSMTKLVITLTRETAIMDNCREAVAAVVKTLEADEDILSGERAEQYKETLSELKGMVKKIAEAGAKMKAFAYTKQMEFNLDVDNAKKDSKANAALEKAQKLRSKKIKGN